MDLLYSMPACCLVTGVGGTLGGPNLKLGTFSRTRLGGVTTMGERGRDLRTRLRNPKQRLSSTSGEGDLNSSRLFSTLSGIQIFNS